MKRIKFDGRTPHPPELAWRIGDALGITPP
jgi:hypothetical protein